MRDKSAAEVIPFSKHGFKKRTRCIPLKIRGEVTFTKPRALSLTLTRPLLALCDVERPIPERLLNRLKRLDDEQLQIVELVAAAMERGAL